MAQHYLLAPLLVLLALSPALASYPPATSYLLSTCDATTYSNLCLQTLLPNVNKINSHPKMSAQLAIQATISAIQSASSKLAQQSTEPQYVANERNSLTECSTLIADSVEGLYDVMQVTNHLGGGDKKAKEEKRINMEDEVKGVMRATTRCIDGLLAAKARGALVSRVQDTTTSLVQLATNVLDIMDHMEF